MPAQGTRVVLVDAAKLALFAAAVARVVAAWSEQCKLRSVSASSARSARSMMPMTSELATSQSRDFRMKNRESYSSQLSVEKQQGALQGSFRLGRTLLAFELLPVLSVVTWQVR